MHMHWNTFKMVIYLTYSLLASCCMYMHLIRIHSSYLTSLVIQYAVDWAEHRLFCDPFYTLMVSAFNCIQEETYTKWLAQLCSLNFVLNTTLTAHVLPASYIVAWLSGQGWEWCWSAHRLFSGWLIWWVHDQLYIVVTHALAISNYTVIMHVHAAVWIDQPTPLKIIALGTHLKLINPILPICMHIFTKWPPCMQVPYIWCPTSNQV